MGADTPRAVLLGMLKRERGLDSDAIAALANGAGYAPEALSDEERSRLDAADLAGAPPHVIGDYPEWLDAHLARAFGDDRAEEGAALASRAPLDLRVNALKTEHEAVAAMLADLAPEPTRWSPWGLRIRLSADAKSPPSMPSRRFLKVWWRFKTRARSSPLSSAAPSPASRSSTSAPAPAARRWRSRR